jgi:hypothetical protein
VRHQGDLFDVKATLASDNQESLMPKTFADI